MISENPSVLALTSCVREGEDMWNNKYPIAEEVVGGGEGWLWGEGDGFYGYYSLDSIWIVTEVAALNIVPRDGFVTFSKGTVVFCGDRKSATNYLLANGGKGKAVIGAEIVAGDNQHVVVGDWGTAIGGNNSTAQAGLNGKATVGDYGIATTGPHGSATSGKFGTANAGEFGTAKAGEDGTIHIDYSDRSNKLQFATGHTDHNHLLPNVFYHLIPYGYNRDTIPRFVPTNDSIVELGIQYFIKRNDPDFLYDFLESNFSNSSFFAQYYEQLVYGLDEKSRRIVDGFLATLLLAK